MSFRGSSFIVEVERDAATYHLLAGEPFESSHHGEPLTIAETPVRLPVPAIETTEQPQQPKGRAPHRRSSAVRDRMTGSPTGTSEWWRLGLPPAPDIAAGVLT